MTRNRLLRHILWMLGFAELTLKWHEFSFGEIMLEAESEAFVPGLRHDWLDVRHTVAAPSGAKFGVTVRREGSSVRTFFVVDSSVVNGNFAVLLACCMARHRKQRRIEEHIQAKVTASDDDVLQITAWRPRLRHTLSAFDSKMMARPASPRTM